MEILKITCVTAAAGLLAACGGGSTNYSAGNVAFAALGEDIGALSNRMETLAPTESAQTPNTTASFSGYAVVAEANDFTVDQPELTFVAIGESNIQINLQTQAVNGSVSGLFEVDPAQLDQAFDGENVGVDDLRVAAITGTLSYTNGDVTGTLGRADGGAAEYALTTDSIELFGPAADAVNFTSTGTATLSNGGVQQAGVFVVAEQ